MFGIDLGSVKDIATDAMNGGDFDFSALTDLLEGNDQVKEVLDKVGIGSVSELIEKLPADALPELVEKVKDDGVSTDTIIEFVKGLVK